MIAAALVIGFHGALEIDRVLKPFLTFIILGWLVKLTLVPQRWIELLQPDLTAPADGLKTK